MKHDDCLDCQTGLNHALQTLVGWNCAVHGPDQISVFQMVSAVADLRTALSASQEREADYRQLIQSLLSDPNSFVDHPWRWVATDLLEAKDALSAAPPREAETE